MNKEELYEMLDIESGEDFQYFENLADLLECGEDIDFNLIANLVDEIEKDNLSQIIKNYFEEMAEAIPGSEGELLTVLDNIQRVLIGLCRTYDSDDTAGAGGSRLAEELERFRVWYSLDSKVYYNKIGETEEQETTLASALLLSRIESLGGDKHLFDFSQCTDYPLEEYVMSIADMIFAEEREDDETEERDADMDPYSDDY